NPRSTYLRKFAVVVGAFRASSSSSIVPMFVIMRTLGLGAGFAPAAKLRVGAAHSAVKRARTDNFFIRVFLRGRTTWPGLARLRHFENRFPFVRADRHDRQPIAACQQAHRLERAVLAQLGERYEPL